MQLQLEKEEELHNGKLNLKIYYHQSELPKQFGAYFGLPPVKLNGKLVCPHYRVVPMKWSYLVTISMAITEKVLTSDAHLGSAK